MSIGDKPGLRASDEGHSGARDLLHVFGAELRRQKWMIAAFCTALLLAEIGLRLFWPNLAGLTYAPDLTGGHKIVLTEKAYRIPEGAEATAPPQVLALGDSTTFGTGVGAEETWPLRLESHLDGPVIARNAGIEGSEPRQMLLGLDTYWSDPAPPPVVVLLVTANMVSFTEFRKGAPVGDPAARAKALLGEAPEDARGVKDRLVHTVQSSALWKAVSLNITFAKYALGLQGHRVSVDAPLSPLLAYGWQQPDLSADFVPQMWAEFETALVALQAKTQSLGSCLVLSFLPPRFEIGDTRLDNLKFVPKDRLTLDAEDRLARMAASLDLPFVSVGAALRAERQVHRPVSRPYYIPGDYTHLDTNGHDLAARSMARVIEPLLTGSGSCRNAPE